MKPDVHEVVGWRHDGQGGQRGAHRDAGGADQNFAA
jgi:hypothetical protein